MAPALWRNGHVNALRSALATSANLPAYSLSKEALMRHGFKDSVAVHMTAGVLSGVATVIANNPVDVIRSRLYNQNFDPAKGTGALYKSPLHAAGLIWRTEGPLAFYKGAGSHCMRAIPHFLLAFTFIEQARRLLGWSKPPEH